MSRGGGCACLVVPGAGVASGCTLTYQRYAERVSVEVCRIIDECDVEEFYASREECEARTANELTCVDYSAEDAQGCLDFLEGVSCAERIAGSVPIPTTAACGRVCSDVLFE